MVGKGVGEDFNKICNKNPAVSLLACTSTNTPVFKHK